MQRLHRTHRIGGRHFRLGGELAPHFLKLIEGLFSIRFCGHAWKLRLGVRGRLDAQAAIALDDAPSEV
ncbi:MAG: hypothetical protein OSB18_14800, partial [SAR324 cluster bacterium]|nr:hypothetical protein [SAR324 cluster bacterium]